MLVSYLGSCLAKSKGKQSQDYQVQASFDFSGTGKELKSSVNISQIINALYQPTLYSAKGSFLPPLQYQNCHPEISNLEFFVL